MNISLIKMIIGALGILLFGGYLIIILRTPIEKRKRGKLIKSSKIQKRTKNTKLEKGNYVADSYENTEFLDDGDTEILEEIATSDDTELLENNL